MDPLNDERPEPQELAGEGERGDVTDSQNITEAPASQTLEAALKGMYATYSAIGHGRLVIADSMEVGRAIEGFMNAFAEYNNSLDDVPWEMSCETLCTAGRHYNTIQRLRKDITVIVGGGES